MTNPVYIKYNHNISTGPGRDLVWDWLTVNVTLPLIGSSGSLSAA